MRRLRFLFKKLIIEVTKIKMNEWNEIYFLIKEHSKQNSKEACFQNKVVNIFEKLGWSRYKKEIETEKSIPIGANNRLRLDILISLIQVAS